jgi:hypothetical protein
MAMDAATRMQGTLNGATVFGHIAQINKSKLGHSINVHSTHLLVSPPAVEKLHGLPDTLVLPGLCKGVALDCLWPQQPTYQLYEIPPSCHAATFTRRYSKRPNNQPIDRMAYRRPDLFMWQYPNNPLINCTALSSRYPDVRPTLAEFQSLASFHSNDFDIYHGQIP